MDKYFLLVIVIIYLLSNVFLAQELKSNSLDVKTSSVNPNNSTEGTNSTANLLVKDVDGNTLMQVNDEGTIGSLTLPSTLTAPSSSYSKLYNINGKLYFNGSPVDAQTSSGATRIDGLSDARSQAYSIFLGAGSGISASLANYNTGVGIDALNKITSGSENVAVGYQTLYNNDTGTDNIAIGYLALKSNKSGWNNIAIGTRSLYTISTTYGNIAIGIDALNMNSSSLNIAIGPNSMRNNTTGDGNIGLGYYSLFGNTTGKWNTSIGVSSMQKNEGGKENVALGHEALNDNISGSFNSAIGVDAMHGNTTGYENTSVGYKSLYGNTSGYKNIAIGSKALYSNNNGTNNVAIGYQSLYSNNGSDRNISIGYQALFYNTTGEKNTTIGAEASVENTLGKYNVAIGAYANGLNQSGSNNTIIGYNAGHGQNLHSKSGNVFIGYEAGKFEQGNNKLYIDNSNTSSPLIGGDFSTNNVNLNGTVNISGQLNANNRLELTDRDATGFVGSGSIEMGNNLRIDGNEIITNEKGTLHLQNDNNGNLKVDNGTLFVDGPGNHVLVGTTSFNGNSGLYVNGTAGGTSSWVNYSDKRLKKNIKTITNALERVKKLRGVNFEWKDPKNNKNGKRIGFIAQEAKDIIPEVVLKDSEYYRMQYAPITALLVEAVKEQNKEFRAENAELKKRIENLENRLNTLNLKQ